MLPAGEYVAESVNGIPYETDKYIITPTPGYFSIEASDIWAVNITVTDGTNPIANASVMAGKNVAHTNTNGVGTLYLRGDSLYTLSIAAEGYLARQISLNVTHNTEATVVLTPASVEIEYLVANAGQGRIVGNGHQRLAPNQQGEWVEAVANPGFAFAGWDDGESNARRADATSSPKQTFTAQFNPITLTLAYTIGQGGRLKSGALHQSVGYGANGTRIEVEPEEGYYFQCWSDGEDSETRTDMNVTKPLAVTAQFGKYQQLPHFNGFESGKLDNGWYIARGHRTTPGRSRIKSRRG